MGASSVLSVGAGSIGDIYRPTERGRAMGLYLVVREITYISTLLDLTSIQGSQLGPPLAPVVSGLMTQ